MTSDAILTELRSLPGAPEGLRERVRALPEPKPRFAWALPRIDIRRVVLVAAPALVAIGVGAAALNGLVEGNSRTPQPLSLQAEQHGAAVTPGACTAKKAKAPPVFGTATVRRLRRRRIAQSGRCRRPRRDSTSTTRGCACASTATVSPRRRPARCRSRAATAATSRRST